MGETGYRHEGKAIAGELDWRACPAYYLRSPQAWEVKRWVRAVKFHGAVPDLDTFAAWLEAGINATLDAVAERQAEDAEAEASRLRAQHATRGIGRR